ncbi:hypothetical protein CERSUDRAFT_122149 [Gelatoporia subvermispora B]|uniref:BTB domain-containing protein n=1 Tax=Ceriporiopsis subvermispora (strain B) TaxID=914234 RepID=M2QSN9_CERS8|nr:hypothetical protein CERSUDRAFT_122149 [Gelatoporia subvermispora B]
MSAPNVQEKNSPSYPHQENAEEAALCERHPTLYIAEGDIVLSAPARRKLADGSDERRSQYFRVHRAVLYKHSAVLRKMLTVVGRRTSRRTASAVVYDGVPHAPLSDDGEDLAAFLHACYRPGELCEHLEKRGLSPAAEAILRIASKYECNALMEPILRIIRGWPTTVDAWEKWDAALDAESFHHSSLGRCSEDCRSCISKRLPTPSHALNLARLYCAEALPGIFYSIARTPTGQFVTWSRELDLGWVCDIRPEDQERLIEGRKKLKTECEKLVDVVLAPPRAPSLETGACRREECEKFKDWLADTIFAQNSYDVLGLLKRCASTFQYGRRVDDGEYLELCSLCQKEVWCRIRKEKSRVWDNLPNIFNLA